MEMTLLLYIHKTFQYLYLHIYKPNIFIQANKYLINSTFQRNNKLQSI